MFGMGLWIRIRIVFFLFDYDVIVFIMLANWCSSVLLFFMDNCYLV